MTDSKVNVVSQKYNTVARNMFSMTQCSNNRGFSLIELMISMLIGLIVLNGVIQIVINSKRSFIDNQEMSQIQENARYAMDILGREVRLAGYFGCVPEEKGAIGTFLTNTANTVLENFILHGSKDGDLVALTGFEGKEKAPAPFKGQMLEKTDAFVIRHVRADDEFVVTEKAAFNGGVLKLSNVDTLSNFAGYPTLLSSATCQDALLFSAGAFDTGSKTLAGLPAQGGAVQLGAFTEGSRLSRLSVLGFYIGESTVVPGMPALMREVVISSGGSVTTRSEELALGVEDMELEYAVSNSNALSDATAITYSDANAITASNNWDKVVAVRINLLFRSQSSSYNVGDFTFLGDTLPDEGFLRQAVTSTIQIRNRG